MKKFVLILMIPCTLFFCSCGEEHKYNEQQAAFEKLLSDSETEMSKQKNDIQKEEYIKVFNQNLFDFISKEKIFVNWEGKISKIRTESKGELAAVEFTISYSPNKIYTREFECTHIVNNNDLESDPIYSKVKTMSDYSPVFFDGFIRTNNSNDIVYSTDYSIHFHPELPRSRYQFFIIDISTESHGELSQNLKEALELSRQYVSIMKQNFLKEITDKKKEEELSKISPEYDAAKDKLSKLELEYLDRYSQAMMFQFLFSD